MQVVSNAKLPTSTKLLLRTASRTHTVSALPWHGLSLRDKVGVMRHVNLFLAANADGGEAGSGASVHSPLLR